MRKWIVILGIGIGLVYQVGVASALTNATLTFSTIASPTGYCRGGYIRANYSFDATVQDGGGDWAALTLTDGAGVPLQVSTASGWPSVSIGLHWTFGEATGAMNDITTMPVTLRLWDTVAMPSGITLQERYDLALQGTPVMELTVNPADYIPACATVESEPGSFELGISTSINGVVGLTDVAVYNSAVVQDSAAFDVYEIVGTTGEYAFTITQEMITPFVDSVVDAQIMVSDSGLIELWALADGRYMLKVADGIGGITVLFFTELGGAMEGYSYNINAPIEGG